MILSIIGFFSGIISGMGIGGGSLLIPALVLFYGLEQQSAQGINLIVFLPISVVAIITHYKNNNIDFSISKWIILGGVFGAIVGSFLAIKINPLKLKKFFGIFLLLIGVYEIFSSKKKNSN